MLYTHISFFVVFSLSILRLCFFSFFFFNDTATTEIYPLSLHDALPIYARLVEQAGGGRPEVTADVVRKGRCGIGFLLSHETFGRFGSGSHCRLGSGGLIRISRKSHGSKIGRAHVSTPVTRSTPMPASSL